MKNRESFSDNTYSLAKSLHHINIAKQFLEDVKLSTTGEVKFIFNQYIQKCDWILNDMKSRLNDESRIILSKELEDSLSFDSINDKLIYLDNDQRNMVEDIISEMIKGQEIKITK